MEKMRLLVGGPMSEWPADLANGRLDGPWAAADRGAVRLLALGQTPVLTVGDFDSMTASERATILPQLPLVVSAHAEKDETDTQLLLRLVFERYLPAEVELYGATGGRLDQLLSNLWIFARPDLAPYAPRVRIIDRSNVVTFYLPGRHKLKKLPEMTYLGFMNLTPVTGLSLLDEKYQLLNWSGDPVSWSSNEFVGQVNQFSFRSGVVAVIQSRDITGQTGDEIL